LKECGRKHGNVFPSRSKRRDFDFEHLETVEEIMSESLLFD
jgi:hypothetical protein